MPMNAPMPMPPTRWAQKWMFASFWLQSFAPLVRIGSRK